MTTQDYALVVEPHFVKNFWPGRDGFMPMALVEHMMQGTIEETFRYFNGEEGPYYVSAHYGIARDGRVWQFVRDEDTAWANGVLNQPDTSIDWIKEVYEEGVNANLITLSIEYEGFSGEGLTEPQYQATLELHRQLLARWEIPVDADHVIGHDRFDSVERKLNPGSAFPWARLLADLQASAPVAEPEAEIKAVDFTEASETSAKTVDLPEATEAGAKTNHLPEIAALGSVGVAAVGLGALAARHEESQATLPELEEATPLESTAASDLPDWLRDDSTDIDTERAIPGLEAEDELPPLNLPDFEPEAATAGIDTLPPLNLTDFEPEAATAETDSLLPLNFADLETQETAQTDQAELPPLNLPDFQTEEAQSEADQLPPLNLADLDHGFNFTESDNEAGSLPPLNLADFEPELARTEPEAGELPPLNLFDLEPEAVEAEPQAGELPPLNLADFEPEVTEITPQSAELPPLNLADFEPELAQAEPTSDELPPLNLPDFELEPEPVEARLDTDELPPLNLPDFEPGETETTEANAESFELPPFELPDFEPEPEPVQASRQVETGELPPLNLGDFEPELVETRAEPQALDDSDIFDFLKTPAPKVQENEPSLDLHGFEPEIQEAKPEAGDLPALNLADFEPDLHETISASSEPAPFELPRFETVEPPMERESLPPLDFDFPEVKPDREEEAATEVTESAAPDLPSWLSHPGEQAETEEAKPLGINLEVSEPLNFQMPQLDQQADAEVKPTEPSFSFPDLTQNDEEITRDEESLPFSLSDLEKEMEAGSGLPDWLTSDAAGKVDLPPLDLPNSAHEPASDSADLPDWLRTSQAQPSSAVSIPEETDVAESHPAELPNWMQSFSAEPEPQVAAFHPETVTSAPEPEADLPSWLNNMREEPATASGSQIEAQLKPEVRPETGYENEGQTEEAEPDLMYPFPVNATPRRTELESFQVGKPETSEPEVAEDWPLPRQVQPESYVQAQPPAPQPEPETPPSPIFEVPENRSAPPAIPETEARDKTVEVVPPGRASAGRDPLEELDDLIFDDDLPPGLTEEQLPSTAEVTAAKPDLPDFADFDNLFDEISGLGGTAASAPIKPFEVEGAPRSSAPVAPPPAPKEETPAPPPPPPPDDRSDLILASVGGGMVAVELANVRKRPSYDPSTVMRTAAKNTRFRFDGYREGPELQGSTRWYHISPEDGSGWIHSALVQLDHPFNPVAQ